LIDAEWIGAGKLDAGAAVNNTVVVNPPSLGFGLLAAAPSAPGKLTVTNLGTSPVTLAVAVAAGAPSSSGNLSAGFSLAVDQTSLTLAAGASGTVNVTLSGSLPKAGAFTGAVTLKATGVSLTVPFTYFV